jgi:hypothetical protein
MEILVHMFAFAEPNDRSKIRKVFIDDTKAEYASQDELLEAVFHYGQNDFQPQQIPSVSVGDVIQQNNKYFMVKSLGFEEISKEQFDNLSIPTAMSAYAGIKFSSSMRVWLTKNEEINES